MVSETPPYLKSCWTGTHLRSATDKLITTHLICIRIGVSLLPGRGGAELEMCGLNLAERGRGTGRCGRAGWILNVIASLQHLSALWELADL